MENMVSKSFLNFWKNKKVFVTGHTGFKGSWMVFFLKSLGCKVAGFSLTPQKKNIIFQNSKLKNNCINFFGDIRNYNLVERSIKKFKPDIIFHMAAQPLVLPSYEDPKETFEVNFNGTLNILEIIKRFKIKSSIIVTTDKVYKNDDSIKFFKETDLIQGSDPYSTSKVDVENLVNCYNHSFFKEKKIKVVTVRAGNVIGGGDRSDYRILPDFFRALNNKKTLKVRFPNAVRPWQYVLDPLFGYLILAKKCYKMGQINYESWNFAQNNKKIIKVKDLISELNKYFYVKVELNNKLISKKEKKYLNLSSYRSNKFLKWKAIYNIQETIEKIVEWETFFRKYKKIDLICKKQIDEYLNKLKLN